MINIFIASVTYLHVCMINIFIATVIYLHVCMINIFIASVTYLHERCIYDSYVWDAVPLLFYIIC